MIVNIQSPGITLKKEITNLLDKKINLLSRRCKGLIGIDVFFKIENSSTNENKLCEIKLAISGYDMIASAQCKTFEEAIAETSEALERQIEKRKTKIQNVQ